MYKIISLHINNVQLPLHCVCIVHVNDPNTTHLISIFDKSHVASDVTELSILEMVYNILIILPHTFSTTDCRGWLGTIQSSFQFFFANLVCYFFLLHVKYGT